MAVKALGLLSGGLDSALATRMIKSLGFEVIALNFSSPFCTCTRKDHGCKNEAKRLADELGIKARVEFMGQEYMEMIRSPKHGYGKNMNPCVDCRIMIFKRAKQVMEEEGAAFIFTGEVAGQRPMSQTMDRMRLIEKESGLEGLVLRPLSAQLMEPTEPEKQGLVDREKLLAIQGRSRKDQIRISREDYGVTENLCSSGGCLLTDPHFSGRMRDLLKNDQSAGVKDARLLRLGRHFRLSSSLKLVVGRNEAENDRLEKMAAPDDFFFHPSTESGVKGPLAVGKGDFGKEDLREIGGIVARYCSGVDGGEVEIEYRRKTGEGSWSFLAAPANEDMVEKLRV